MSVKNLARDIKDNLRDKTVAKNYRKKYDLLCSTTNETSSNKNISIFASDCTGGMIYHDFHMQFCSPLINMFLMADDYVRFCKDISYWIDRPMIEVDNTGFPYPLARLDGRDGGVMLHLVHYKTVREAQEIWNRRKSRIIWDRMFFIMNDRNECSKKQIKAFERLPYENKVFFSHKNIRGMSSCYKIEGFEREDYVGIMTKYRNLISLKRNYDQFNWVRWFGNSKA